MQMWTCFDSDLIAALLEEILGREEPLTIWQTSATGSRDKLAAKVHSVQKNNVQIELAPAQGGQFSATDPLYVHCQYRDIVFKRDRFKKEGLIISFVMPNEIKIKDMRKVQRLAYRYQDSKIIAFNTPHPTDPNQSNLKLSSILVDISTEGLSFVMPEREMGHLGVGVELFITRLTDQQLPNEHRAQILYIVQYRGPHDGDQRSSLIKIGVKFLEPLEAISYKSISSLITKKQTRVQGLNVKTFNGLNDEEQERILRKIGEENRVLANNIRERIEQLDRLRYLTTQMKQQFLMEVNKDLLAAALRLSSKELIFDLLSEITDTMREEFLFKLDQPKSASAVNKAQDEVCKFITAKEKAGELVLDPTAFEQYV